jgi:hypothetical protein
MLSHLGLLILHSSEKTRMTGRANTLNVMPTQIEGERFLAVEIYPLLLSFEYERDRRR